VRQRRKDKIEQGKDTEREKGEERTETVRQREQ
jgi:hypothetical protein